MTGRDEWGNFESLNEREAATAKRRYAELMHSKTHPDYAGFVREASQLNLDDFSADAELKDNSLRKFFPGRYKTHHWGEMDNAQRGSLYRKLYNYAQRH